MLELAQNTFVDDDVVAQQSCFGAPADRAFDNFATRNLANFGDRKDLLDPRLAEAGLFDRRFEHAGQDVFHLVDKVVDHRVIADLKFVALGTVARLDIGPHAEADHQCAGRCREGNVRFVDAANRAMNHADRDLVGRQFFQRTADRLKRPLDVGFDNDREQVGFAFGDFGEHLFQRSTSSGGQCDPFVARGIGTEAGDFTGAGFTLHHTQFIARTRGAGQAEHFCRFARAKLVNLVAMIIDQSANFAPFGAGHNDVAHTERAALNQRRRYSTASTIKFGFDHDAFGRPVRVCFKFEQFGLEDDQLLEAIKTSFLSGRDLDGDHFTAQLFDHKVVLQ